MKNQSSIKKAIKSYKSSVSSCSPPPACGGGEWITEATFDETRQVIGKSFAGTAEVSGEPVFDWCVNHIGEWYTPEHHTSTTLFMIAFHIYATMKQKETMVVSKRSNDGEAVVSAAIVTEYDPKKAGGGAVKKVVESWRWFRAFCKLTSAGARVPELFDNKKRKKEGNDLEKKLEHVISLFEKWHKEDGPQEVHWYVEMVGVDPEANGKGYGRELMQKVNDLADEVGMLCYLECGTSNRGFFEKMGYHVLSTRSVEDAVDSKREPLDCYLLIRRPLPPTHRELC
jgi:ribosomal protein S18 acetylase RimI-like enzyme